MTELRALLEDLADAIVAAVVNGPERVEERAVCAGVTERLQRRFAPYVVVNECPYGDGSARDGRCDLKVFYGLDRGIPLWVELKPLMRGANYWNFSKFFSALPEDGAPLGDAPSIVLDDIDKLESLWNESEGRQGVAFALLLWTDGRKLAADPSLPRPGRALTPGQVLSLASRRFEARMKGPAVVVRRESGTGFEVVLLAAECQDGAVSPADGGGR